MGTLSSNNSSRVAVVAYKSVVLALVKVPQMGSNSLHLINWGHGQGRGRKVQQLHRAITTLQLVGRRYFSRITINSNNSKKVDNLSKLAQVIQLRLYRQKPCNKITITTSTAVELL